VSDEKKLVLSTRESLYDPIEVEIDGKTYQSIKITRDVSLKLDEIEKRIREKDTQATCEYVQAVFGIEDEVLGKLDYREIEDIYLYVLNQITQTERKRIARVQSDFGLTKDQAQKVQEVIPKNVPRPKGKRRPK